MSAPRKPPVPGNAPSKGILIWLLVLGAALGLRIGSTLNASFHLDDFHSLHHARAQGWMHFFEVLRLDNHPPLSFAILHGVRSLFGEGEFAIRLPAVLFGLWHVALTGKLASHFGGRRIQVAAALFVAFSSLAIEQSSDLRMYAPLAVAVTGLLDAVLDAFDGRRASLRIALYSWLGLHVHYHFVHALAVIGLAILTALALHPQTRARLRVFVVGFGAAILFSLPWYLSGFRWQLGHELAPGGSQVSLTRLASSYVHLSIHELRVAGPQLHMALAAAGCLAVLLGSIGWLMYARKTKARPSILPLAAAAFLLPAWSALIAWLIPRAGYEWRYVIGAVAPFGVCFALGAFGDGPALRLRKILGTLALAGSLTLATLHVLDPGRENYRDAAAYILDRAEAKDGVVAADWQPRIFPHSGAWMYYSSRSGREDLPTTILHEDDFSLHDASALANYDRVFVMLRSIPNDVGLLETLRATYATEDKQVFGEAIWVHEFRDRRTSVVTGD